jgi:hypothetical protein
MNETTKILPFRQPSAVDDPLTEILRKGARDRWPGRSKSNCRRFLRQRRS